MTNTVLFKTKTVSHILRKLTHIFDKSSHIFIFFKHIYRPPPGRWRPGNMWGQPFDQGVNAIVITLLWGCGVYRVYRVYKVYKVYRGYRVNGVNKVNRENRVNRVNINFHYYRYCLVRKYLQAQRAYNIFQEWTNVIVCICWKFTFLFRN